MEFNILFGLLYQYCNDGSSIDEFMRDLFGFLISEPVTWSDRKKEEDDNYNPLFDLESGTIKAYADGRRIIAKSRASFILAHLNKQGFIEYINGMFGQLPEDSLNSLVDNFTKEFREHYNGAITADNIGEVCATLLVAILEEIVKTKPKKKKETAASDGQSAVQTPEDTAGKTKEAPTAPDEKKTSAGDDRPVTPQKLWNAGRDSYRRSVGAGGRFRFLKIEEDILPFYDSEGGRGSVRTALEESRGSLYLIGEGGAGKTTALFRVMERNYKNGSFQPGGEIPLFVELSGAPGVFGTWYKGAEGMKSTYIRRELCRQLLDCEELSDVPDDMVKALTAEFKREPSDGRPAYWLLLDGLNEVSMNEIADEETKCNGETLTGNVRSLVIDEINTLLVSGGNVRILLAGRTDEPEIDCKKSGLKKLYLTGLEPREVENFLSKKAFTPNEIRSALADKDLLKCLTNPLFLTMYADLRHAGAGSVTNRGEILRRFFHERGENPEYTQQEVSRKLKSTAPHNHIWFVLDFLLPAIGSEMERRGIFTLSTKEIAGVIQPILRGWKPGAKSSEPTDEPYDASIIGDYGKACFDKYEVGRKNVGTTAEEILRRGKTPIRTAEYVLSCAADVLRVLYRDKNQYGFIHHYFRDYFAAVHDINCLRVAVFAYAKEPDTALESLAPFIGSANSIEKAVFIGEILGENRNAPFRREGVWHYNVPNTGEDRALLRRALGMMRGRPGSQTGYGVYNLIEPVRLVRRDLSGSDLSGLDLTAVPLNGVRMGHTASDGVNCCGASLRMKNLLSQGHSGSVNCIACCPGKNSTTFLSASADGTVKEWDSATGQCVRTYGGQTGRMECVACAPDGGTFISGSYDNTVREWDRSTSRCVREYVGHDGTISCVAYAPDGGSRFLSGSHDSTVREWDRATGRCLRVYAGHEQPVAAVAYGRDGSVFLSASYDGTVREWDAAAGTCVRICRCHDQPITSLSLSPTENTFLTGSHDGTVREWNRASGRCVGTYDTHGAEVECVAYAPDGTSFLCGAWDGTVRKWNAGTWQCIRVYAGNDGGIMSAAFTEDGHSFLTGSWEGSVREWSAEIAQCIREYKGSYGGITAAVYRSGGSGAFLYGSSDGSVREWAGMPARCLRTVVCGGGRIDCLAPASEDDRFFAGMSDNVIREWELSTEQCIREYEGHTDRISCIVCPPDGRRILSGSYDKTIREWERADGRCADIYEGHGGRITCAAVVADGRTFVSGGEDCLVKEWDRTTGQCIRNYAGHTGRVTSLAASPDGKSIVSASGDRTVREWDRATGDCLRRYSGHTRAVTCVAFSPDGKTLLSGSSDNKVIQWDRATGECLRVGKGHTHTVRCVAFAPDGMTFLSCSLDGTVRIWSAASGECLDVIRNCPGLIVNGCDMRRLKGDSSIDKALLYRYGAFVDG